MTPAELIRAQAEKVTGFSKLSAAEHLEAAAKLLRGESAEDAKAHSIKAVFADLKKKKAKGLQRMTEGFNAMKKAQIEDAFAGSDWVVMKESPEGVKTYCRKGRGHLYINIKGDQFSVTEGETTGRYSLVSNLAAFVAHEKKNRK